VLTQKTNTSVQNIEFTSVLLCFIAHYVIYSLQPQDIQRAFCCVMHILLLYMCLYIFNSEGSRCRYILCTACPLASEGYLLFHYTLNAAVLNVEDFVSLSCLVKVFCRYMGMLSVECMLVLHMQCLGYMRYAVSVSDIHMSVQLELKVEGFLTGLLQLYFGIFV